MNMASAGEIAESTRHDAKYAEKTLANQEFQLFTLAQGRCGILISRFESTPGSTQPATCYDISHTDAPTIAPTLADVVVSSALVLNGVDARTFNEDQDAKNTLATSLVQTISSVKSVDQISNIRATEYSGRRLLTGQTEI